WAVAPDLPRCSGRRRPGRAPSAPPSRFWPAPRGADTTWCASGRRSPTAHERDGLNNLHRDVPPPADAQHFLEVSPIAVLLGHQEVVRHEHGVRVEACEVCLALHATRGNKSEAARLLRVDYKTLHLTTKRYSIDAAE